MKLSQAETLKEYRIRDIETDDEEMRDFLFTLGCYEGEPLTVVKRDNHNLVIALKDARYNIDQDLADAIAI